MKKGTTFVIFLILLGAYACRTGNREDRGIFVEDADHIQIVLFHLTQRCESCNAVERETQWLLEQEYGEEVLSGKIKFVSLDYQSKSGKKAASLLQASGQTLFVLGGDSLSNLTSAAFMYASTHPEIYLEALRKELDLYLE